MPRNRIRIIIADDQKLFVEGLRLILQKEDRIEVVCEAENGKIAVRMAGEFKPDVLLLSIMIPGLDSIDALTTIRRLSPDTKTLILTIASAEERNFEALKEGARGYLTKNINGASLIKAIKAVHQGEMWLDRKLMTRLFEKENLEERIHHDSLCKNGKSLLTKREREVLFHLKKGISNKEIAAALYISEKTIKTHLNSIFKKLNVTCRLQALLRADKEGIC